MLFTTDTREGEHFRHRTAEPAGPGGLAPHGRWYPAVKAFLDFIAALTIFLVTLPLVLIAALLVKLTSRGPAFYSQTRLGLHGRPYTIFKLRTMVHNCETLSGPRWATTHDPRITPLGRFLRHTHLDEFPQLWNVLRGEMSLVGPRPERPEFVPQLERAIPHYRDRLAVRPGITGLAQVQVPADTDLSSVRRKLAYDLYYIRRLGPWLDLQLILCTGLSLLGVPFWMSCRFLRIPGSDKVERGGPPSANHRVEPLVTPSPVSPTAGA